MGQLIDYLNFTQRKKQKRADAYAFERYVVELIAANFYPHNS